MAEIAMVAARHLPLLATFVQVCRSGSFTSAARHLSISKGVVSAQLRALERALGVRLLERTTRRVSLTEIGREVLAAAERTLLAASEISSIAETKQLAPTGVLRVGAPVDLGALLVAPAVARLCTQHPELRAELLLSDEKTDQIENRLDVVLSVNVPKNSPLISTRLGTDFEIIVASPELARAYAGVTDPRGLSDAPWVAHPAIPVSARRVFRNSEGVIQRISPGPPRALANTSDAIRSLVVGGVGFAVLPMQMVVDDLSSGRMLRMAPAWTGRHVVVHACHASSSHSPTRVKLFLAELRNVFKISGLEARYDAAAPRHPLRILEAT